MAKQKITTKAVLQLRQTADILEGLAGQLHALVNELEVQDARETRLEPRLRRGKKRGR